MKGQHNTTNTRHKISLCPDDFPSQTFHLQPPRVTGLFDVDQDEDGSKREKARKSEKKPIKE